MTSEVEKVFKFIAIKAMKIPTPKWYCYTLTTVTKMEKDGNKVLARMWNNWNFPTQTEDSEEYSMVHPFWETSGKTVLLNLPEAH